MLEQNGDTNSEMYKYVSGIVEAYDNIYIDVQKLLQIEGAGKSKVSNFININNT